MSTYNKPPTPHRALKKYTKLRRLHRWLGIGALSFLLLLCVTGVALNHAQTLGLDGRYATASWLLDWYDLALPEPTASFATAGNTVTLVGQRLFVGSVAAQVGAAQLRGALELDNGIVAATDDTLMLLSPTGELLDIVRLGAAVRAPIEMIGLTADAAAVVLRTADGNVALDAGTLASAGPIDEEQSVRWSVPTPLSETQRAQIERGYRGDGLALDRVLYDIHSGRFFGWGGVLLMDVAGLAVIALSISGLVLWLR